MTLILCKVPRQAKIRDLGLKPLIQQYVAGLYVPVYNPHLGLSMQIS